MLRGKRVKRCTKISQDFDTETDCEGDGTERIPKLEPMIPLRRAVEFRKAFGVLSPIEFATVDYDFKCQSITESSASTLMALA